MAEHVQDSNIQQKQAAISLERLAAADPFQELPILVVQLSYLAVDLSVFANSCDP